MRSFFVLLLLASALARGQAFDGARALEAARALAPFGPRPAGSEALAAARAELQARIGALGLRAELRPFTAKTPLGPVPMANLVVRLPGRTADTLVIGGHLESKRTEPPTPGANDGLSQTGLLLELLRVAKDRPRRLSLEVVFFDGEEALVAWKGTDHTYGSRAYLASRQGPGRLRGMVNLDMVGDATLGFPRIRGTSRLLTGVVWASARRLGHGASFLETFRTAEDDHTPFAAAGIPTVDLLDWDYAPYHTPEDTVERLSARSLQMVGDVLLDALPHLETALLGR